MRNLKEMYKECMGKMTDVFLLFVFVAVDGFLDSSKGLESRCMKT